MSRLLLCQTNIHSLGTCKLLINIFDLGLLFCAYKLKYRDYLERFRSVELVKHLNYVFKDENTRFFQQDLATWVLMPINESNILCIYAQYF